VFIEEGSGGRLRLGRLGAEPERQVVAAFNPVPLGTLDVLVSPHAVIELRVGVVRAVNDQGGQGILSNGSGPIAASCRRSFRTPGACWEYGSITPMMPLKKASASGEFRT
jgi:hypothetical protein